MIHAVLLAAGRGQRFGSCKVTRDLGGKPVWRWSYDVLKAHPRVRDVVVVHGAHHGEWFADWPGPTVLGGATRQASVAAGIAALPPDAEIALIHDAARPFLTPELVDRVLASLNQVDGAAPAVPITDTLRDAAGVLVDREALRAMQTPQAVRLSFYRDALAHAPESTDDLAVLQSAGYSVRLVPGDPGNFKLTTPEDWARAEARAGRGGHRTGIGYDVHRFSSDPARPLWLGGVLFPGERGLEGHSDADAVLHAVTDAVLGAATKGDIGRHFPPGDERWRNARSARFLEHARDLAAEDGWRVVHVDVAVLAEHPKVSPRADEIRRAISDALEVAPDAVSIKATTNEGLGFVGRGEGIAATAVATLRR